MSNVDTNFSDAMNDFAKQGHTMKEDDKEQTYHLSCKVKVVRETKTNVQANGEAVKYEATMALLIPEESSEQIKFWNCYLPEYVSSIESELVFMNLVNGRPFRGYIDVANKHVDRRHIGVMSRDMIDFLKSFDGKLIRVDCLPCSEHDKLDV